MASLHKALAALDGYGSMPHTEHNRQSSERLPSWQTRLLSPGPTPRRTTRPPSRSAREPHVRRTLIRGTRSARNRPLSSVSH